MATHSFKKQAVMSKPFVDRFTLGSFADRFNGLPKIEYWVMSADACAINYFFPNLYEKLLKKQMDDPERLRILSPGEMFINHDEEVLDQCPKFIQDAVWAHRRGQKILAGPDFFDVIQLDEKACDV